MGTCLLHCQKSPGWVLMCHLCCALLPVAVLFVSVCCHLNSCCGAIVCHLGVSGPLSHCCPWRVGWDGFTSLHCSCPRAAVPCVPGSPRPRAQHMPWSRAWCPRPCGVLVPGQQRRHRGCGAYALWKGWFLGKPCCFEVL